MIVYYNKLEYLIIIGIIKTKLCYKQISLTTQNIIENLCLFNISYEPAGLSVHPPQKKRSRVGSFFSHGCLVPPEFVPKKIVDFVGDIKS